MPRLPAPNLGDRGHRPARLEARASGLVVGGLSDGHPFQRHLGVAAAETIGARLVQIGLAVVRQAAPGDGRPGRNLLSGLVEVDETTVNYRTRTDPAAGGQGRSGTGKLGIAGAVELDNDRPGRIRLAPIEDFAAASLHPFLAANIAPGSTAKTDGWSGYDRAPGVDHQPHVIGAMAAHVVLPWIHRVFANLKTWALGVYHGLRPKYLQTYLDEFVFRFNRRRTRHAAFHSLLSISLSTKPLTYRMLIQPEHQG